MSAPTRGRRLPVCGSPWPPGLLGRSTACARASRPATCTPPPPARLGPHVPVLSPHGPGGHTPSPGCRVPRDGALMSTVALRLRGGGGDHKSIWSIF